MAAIGVAVISDGQPWEQNRDIIRRMKPDIVRVRTPIGFGFTPAQLDTIITDNPNLQTIVLCTEDAIVTPKQFKAELFDRGFVDVIKRYDLVADFVIEIGNESNLQGADIWQHRYDALRTLKAFRPHPDLQRVRWSVSLPTILTETIDLLARDQHGCILDHIDIHCAHLYGWYELGDGAGDDGKWNDILSYLLKTTNKNIIITEAGIDDRDTPKAEKARRYLRWAASAHPRIEGVCLWGVGDWSGPEPGRNPSMEIDAAMADVLGSRHTEPQQPPAPEPQPSGPVTMHSPFKAPASISEDGFVAVLESKGSFNSDALWNPTPRPARPNEARRIYAHITSQGHDPAVWLAILGKESSYGTNEQSVLHRGSTRSWTNARTVRDRSLIGWSLYTDPQRNSSYVKYRSVYDSVQDGIYRVDDPSYAYKDARTILEVVSIWAPSSDSNNPKAYAQQMADWINVWQQQYPAEQEQPMSLIETIGQRIRAHGIEVHDIRNRMPTDGSYSRYSGPYPTHTAVHYTAVRRSPASLEAEINSWVGHGRYHVSSQGWPGIAYTIGISLSGRVFLLGEAELWRYHAFNDNPRAFPISHDMTLGQEPTPEMRRSLETVLKVLHEETPEFPNLTRALTYGHQEFGRIPGGDSRNLQTNCPGGLLPLVQQYRAGAPITNQPEPPACIGFNETEHTVCHGFRAFWEKYGELKVFGFPITAEIQENGMTVQYFERARFEFQPGSNADDFDVILGRLGAELLAARSDE